MCLQVDNNVKIHAKENGDFIAYKIYRPRCGVLHSLYRHSVVMGPGIIKSTATRVGLNRLERKKVSRGIHVYLNRRDAEIESYKSEKRVVAVSCNLKYLRARGKFAALDSAVLKQVELSKREWNKAMRR